MASPAGGDRRHVHYVLMAFPAPSEAFARLEIRALLDAGCDVSVSTFRARPSRWRALLAEFGLEELPVSNGGLAAWAAGLIAACLQPAAAVRLARRALEGVTASPRQSLIALLLVPRALGIAREILDRGVDQVHLFWGHYPALVGLALRETGQAVDVSMFLGAYDLVRRFPASRVLARQVPVTTHARVNVTGICEFTGLAPERVSVIHRGIRVPSRRSDTVPDEPPTVVVAERLVGAKRTTDAIAAFDRVRADVPGAVLHVFGDGPEAERLRASVAARGLVQAVTFHGHVSHRRLQEAFARAHVYLSMSQSEGERLPNAAKEAMAAYCPVVLARSPGIDELVASGQTGYIVAPGDVEDAARRVTGLLRDSRRREDFADRARRHIEAEFDIEDATRRRLAFWGLDGPAAAS